MILKVTRALASICAGLLALSTAFAQAPTNDDFANRTALTGSLPIVASGDSSNATLESGEFPPYSSTRSVWWSWTPTVSGSYSIDTNGSSYDTVLAIYSGNSLANVIRLAYNDDYYGTRSRVQLNFSGGVEYQIAVTSFSSGFGPITLNITPAASITSSLTALAVVGADFSYQTTASNSPTSFSFYSLPTGLNYNYTTGEIYGIPTAPAGVYNVGITAYGGYPTYETANGTLELTLSDTRPAITSSSVYLGTQAQAVSYQITATNSPMSYGASGLPDGLNLEPTTGLITGSPTQAGTFYVSVTASNTDGVGPAKQVTFYIESAAPQVFGDSLEINKGQSVNFQITATHTPTSYGAEGLPPGLVLDTATGKITGRPTVSGSYQIPISATNTYGTGSESFYLFVYDRLSDTFAGRTPITGKDISRYVTNAAASEEVGEPDHAGVEGSGSLWMTWTAPEAGQYEVSTDGFLFAVYTGDTLPKLKEVMSSRDLGYGPPASLVFKADAGKVYQIALDTSTDSGAYTGYFRLRKIGTNLAKLLHIGSTQGGTVTTGFLGNTYQTLGAQLTIQAIPAPGYLFTGWTGVYDVPGRTLSFTMQDGMAFTANFIQSPFLSLRGNYAGLIRSGGYGPTSSSTGAFMIRLGGNGSFTGTVTFSNGTFPFHGSFDLQGNFNGTIDRRNQWPLAISLSMDVTDPTVPMQGTIGDDLFSSSLSATRSSVDPTLNPTPVAGNYTFLINGDAPTDGNGFGTASIALSGAVRFTGVLPDGTPFTRGSYLNDASSFALYATAYSGRGCVSGTVSVQDDGYTDFQGNLTWIKPPTRDLGPNADGFTLEASISGSTYAAPPAGTRPLTVYANTANLAFSAQIDMGDEELNWTVNRTLTLTPEGIVRVVGRKPVSMALDTKRGIYRGSFVDDGGIGHVFSGVLFQRYNGGYGLFYAGIYRGAMGIGPVIPDDGTGTGSTGSSGSSGGIIIISNGSNQSIKGGGGLTLAPGAGTLTLNNSGVVGGTGTSGAISVISNPTSGSSISLVTAGSGTSASTISYSGATLTMNSRNVFNSAPLSTSGGVAVSDATVAGATLVFSSSNHLTLSSGVVTSVGTTGALTLTKTGSGTLQLIGGNGTVTTVTGNNTIEVTPGDVVTNTGTVDTAATMTVP